VEELAKFSPGLIPRMYQVYSGYNKEKLISDLNSAGQQKRQFDESLNTLKRARLGGSKGDTYKDYVDTYAKGIASLGRIAEDLSNPMLLGSQELVQSIFKSYIEPGLMVMNNFGTRTGIIPKGGVITPGEVARDLQKATESGDVTGLIKFRDKINNYIKNAQKEMNTPKDAPKRVKSNKRPTLVGDTTSMQGPINKKNMSILDLDENSFEE